MRAAAPPGSTLVVCIHDTPDALLPMAARAEMAAALAAVDYVLTEPPLPSLAPNTTIDLRPEDATCATAVRQRVFSRQGAAGKPAAE